MHTYHLIVICLSFHLFFMGLAQTELPTCEGDSTLSYNTLRLRGRSLAQQGRLDDAVVCLDRALGEELAAEGAKVKMEARKEGDNEGWVDDDNKEEGGEEEEEGEGYEEDEETEVSEVTDEMETAAYYLGVTFYTQQAAKPREERDFQKAITMLTRASKLRPKNVHTWTTLAHACMESNLPDTVALAYEQLLKLNPADYRSAHQLAYARSLQKLWVHAIKEYRHALKLVPADHHAARRAILTNLLTVHFTRGQIDDGISDYCGAKTPAGAYNYAQLFRKNEFLFPEENRLKFAVDNFNDALPHSKSLPWARIELASVQRALGKLDDVYHTLCEAYLKRPNSPLVIDMMHNHSISIEECPTELDAIADSRYPRVHTTLTTQVLYPTDLLGLPPWSTPEGTCESRYLGHTHIVDKIIEHAMHKAVTQSHYVLDVQAGDGVTVNQMGPLFQRMDLEGIAFESNEQLFPKLLETLSRGFQGHRVAINPSNVVEQFERHHVPKEFLGLRVAQHAFECQVMKAILKEGYRPRFVALQVNVAVPPPIRFGTKYDPSVNASRNFEWKGGIFHGCSLSYASNIMKRHGYTLLQMDWTTAIYVQDAFIEAFGNIPHSDETLFYLGFYGREDRLKCVGFRTSTTGGDPIWGANMHLNTPELERWMWMEDAFEAKEDVKIEMSRIARGVDFTVKL